MNYGLGYNIKESHTKLMYMGKIKSPLTWLKWQKIIVITNVDLREISIIK